MPKWKQPFMPRTDHRDVVGEIRDQLREQAHVFEDPDSYVAGVDDALAQLRLLTLDRHEPPAGR